MFKEFSQDEYGNKSNSSFKRFAFRANLDFLMTKDLTLSVNFGTRFEERRGPNSNEARDGSYSQAFYEMNHTPGWLFPVSYTVGEGEDQKTLYSGSSQYQNNIVVERYHSFCCQPFGEPVHLIIHNEICFIDRIGGAVETGFG